MGARNPVRHSSDLLPYLPRYRRFFVKLPSDPAEIEFDYIKVPLSDIDALLNHCVKVKGPPWYLKVRNGIGDSISIAL